MSNSCFTYILIGLKSSWFPCDLLTHSSFQVAIPPLLSASTVPRLGPHCFHPQCSCPLLTNPYRLLPPLSQGYATPVSLASFLASTNNSKLATQVYRSKASIHYGREHAVAIFLGPVTSLSITCSSSIHLLLNSIFFTAE